jgi:hypothetical protein
MSGGPNFGNSDYRRGFANAPELVKLITKDCELFGGGGQVGTAVRDELMNELKKHLASPPYSCEFEYEKE